MEKNIRVIGGYKCGCSYGPIWQKDRIEYCGVHGGEIANEYDVSFMSAPNKAYRRRVPRRGVKPKKVCSG